MAATGAAGQGETPASTAFSEAAGAAGVLAVAGVLLVLFIRSLNAGAGAPSHLPAGAERAPDYRTSAVPVEQAVILIAVGPSGASAIESLLAKETELRTLLGESPRDARVIVAGDPAAAESIRQAVDEQAAIPGLPAVRAVIVTAP